MTHITCRLTAKNWDQLRNPTLGNRVRATFTFLPFVPMTLCIWHAAHTVDDLIRQINRETARTSVTTLCCLGGVSLWIDSQTRFVFLLNSCDCYLV